MSRTLTHTSPWVMRFFAWVQERFPLVQGLLILAMYAALLLAGKAVASPDAVLEVDWRDGAGFFGLWAFFLMLRVFDEHKDYAKDCLHHGDRVLQRGVITLTHLKVVGVIAIAIQLVTSILQDHGVGPATIWWGAVMGWSALMAKEFFIGSWLEKKLTFYATSHMLVMPLAVVWIMAMGGGEEVLTPLVDVAPLLIQGFVAGAMIELVRKTRAPQEERSGVDSYSQRLGLRGAATALIVFCAMHAGAQSWWLVSVLDVPFWVHVIAWLPVAGVVASLAAFLMRPSAKGRARNEAVVGLSVLIGYLLIAASVVSTHMMHLSLQG